jgi:ribose 5-phosphate isomerase RpiB
MPRIIDSRNWSLTHKQWRSAHQCVEHDDVNLLAIGAQIIGVNVAQEIVTAFLAATFSTDPDFRRRVAKLRDMEIAGAKELLGD